jgi:hypothetical protein
MDHVRRRVHRGAAIYDGSILRSAEPGWDRRIEPGRTPGRDSTQVRMLLSFQRPPRPVGKGIPSQETRPDARSDRRGPPSIARLTRSLQEVPRGGRRPERPRDCSASRAGPGGGAAPGRAAEPRGAGIGAARGGGAAAGRAAGRAARAAAGAARGGGARRRRAAAGPRRGALRTESGPRRCARVGDRRSPRGRPAARYPGPARRRRSGSSRWGRSRPPADGCGRWCRG